jgi:hypothetical protein
VIISSQKSNFLETTILDTGQRGSLQRILQFVDLGSEDEKLLGTHLEALGKHKPIDLLEALYRLNLLFSRAKLYQLFLELRPKVFPATIDDIDLNTSLESTSFQRMDEIRKALADYCK